MKVVTFNSRFDNPDDGSIRFEYRKPFILEKITSEDPDIIGFQEVLPHMLAWYKESLKGYTVLGCGREDDLTGETPAVAFKTDRFNLMQMETFWLSPTPMVPGSRYEQQSDCPRTCTMVLLHDLKTDLVFRVYNTHLDHEGEQARVLGISQVLHQMEIQTLFPDAPALVMGDFNAFPDEKVYQDCVEHGLSELTIDAKATFHGFGKFLPGEKIDYIFGTDAFVCKSCSIWDDKKGELYLSDHYPVCIEVEIK